MKSALLLNVVIGEGTFILQLLSRILDVVIGEGAFILELLSREDQTMLVGRIACLVLDLGIHIVNGV